MGGKAGPYAARQKQLLAILRWMRLEIWHEVFLTFPSFRTGHGFVPSREGHC